MSQDSLGMVLVGHKGLGWFRVGSVWFTGSQDGSDWLTADHGDLVLFSLVQNVSRRLMIVLWFRVVHVGPVWWL
jgi:hypothetical protein